MSMLELRPKNSMEYSKNGFPTLYKPPSLQKLNHTINPDKRNDKTLRLIPVKNQKTYLKQQYGSGSIKTSGRS